MNIEEIRERLESAIEQGEFCNSDANDILSILSLIDRYRDTLEGIAGQISSSAKIADDMREMAQEALEGKE